MRSIKVKPQKEPGLKSGKAMQDRFTHYAANYPGFDWLIRTVSPAEPMAPARFFVHLHSPFHRDERGAITYADISVRGVGQSPEEAWDHALSQLGRN